LHMPSHVPVRALAVSRRAEAGSPAVLVAVGGRLTYAVWSLDMRPRPPSIYIHNVLARSLGEGTLKRKAAQDHRILTVAVSPCRVRPLVPSTLKMHSGHVVFMGDSRGRGTVAVVRDRDGGSEPGGTTSPTFHIVDPNLEVSSCPLLCSDLMVFSLPRPCHGNPTAQPEWTQVLESVTLAVVGDTAGEVFVWQLKISPETSPT